jgi:hypothetical protein
VKRTAIGQHFVGALVNVQQRPIMKRDQRTGELGPVVKPDGKHKQELVLTLIAMPGTTAPAGLGDTTVVPTPGDKVRLILRGRSFGDWIEAKKGHGALQTGDVVEQTTDHGQAYDSAGAPTGNRLTTQAEIDNLPRQQTFGIYGTLTLRKPTPAEAEWATKADEAHHEVVQQARTVIDDEAEEPF